MNSEGALLTPEGLRTYLADNDLVRGPEALTVRPLGGGVSNLVFLVEGPGIRWVAKQSLAKLRVQDDWPADRERIFREAEAIELLRPLLRAQAGLGVSRLPDVIHIDRENYFFLMTAAPEGSVVWKEMLLCGQVEVSVARDVGLLLGRLIQASRADRDLQARFEDRRAFDQLRVDPYYRTVAARQADVRSIVEELISDSWQVRTAIVHGDYSPKNILVCGRGELFLIDFEVVHWGDPAFDAGFLLNHLFLKALYQPRFAELYFSAAHEFWKALVSYLEEVAAQDLEAMTLRHLGALMLARIDGKSPVEYIGDDATKNRVRAVAKRILRDRPQRLADAVQLVRCQAKGQG